MNMNYVRLGKIQSSLILLTLIVRNLGGLVLGRTFRDGARVEADYDQGCWKECSQIALGSNFRRYMVFCAREVMGARLQRLIISS